MGRSASKSDSQIQVKPAARRRELVNNSSRDREGAVKVFANHRSLTVAAQIIHRLRASKTAFPRGAWERDDWERDGLCGCQAVAVVWLSPVSVSLAAVLLVPVNPNAPVVPISRAVTTV